MTFQGNAFLYSWFPQRGVFCKDASASLCLRKCLAQLHLSSQGAFLLRFQVFFALLLVPQVTLPSLVEYVSLILGSACIAHTSKTVLVCSGCHNKMPQTGCLKPQTFIYHSERGWEVQDQGASKVGSILRTLPLASRCCVLTWPLLCVHMVWGAGISSSFYKGTNHILKAPPSWLHLTLITSKRPCIQISHWGWGFQYMSFRRDTFSP